MSDTDPAVDACDVHDEILVLRVRDVEQAAADLAEGVDDESTEWYQAGYVDGVFDLMTRLIDDDPPRTRE
jgi:hypothetical protein